ncbi:interleukin-8b.3 [Ictalurus punctatus]|uniref:Interleukin-8b.3 n=1 Tax=Ictalurus punctatus TaxID=7998 RepID=A0A2D0RC29_ICTPU|nr:interleukin-8b.3 [Ictalurus punctatus]
MKLSALAITFLAFVLISMTEGLIQPRCWCTKMATKEISDHRIVKMQTFQPGPRCKHLEIIATVKFRKEHTLCLNPKDAWVQKALKRRNLAQ